MNINSTFCDSLPAVTTDLLAGDTATFGTQIVFSFDH